MFDCQFILFFRFLVIVFGLNQKFSGGERYAVAKIIPLGVLLFWSGLSLDLNIFKFKKKCKKINEFCCHKSIFFMYDQTFPAEI